MYQNWLCKKLIYLVFSIVNGLCLNNSLDIDGVYFLIEGKQQEGVAGMGVKDGGPFTEMEDL